MISSVISLETGHAFLYLLSSRPHTKTRVSVL